jgi:hypothetical protein
VTGRRAGPRLAAIAWAIALVIAAGAGGARAADSDRPPGASSVAVIRPPPGDPVLDEASARIQLEMAAVGNQSRLVDCPHPEAPGASQCASLSSAVRIWLSREEGTVFIQVVAALPDGLELRRHVRVAPSDGGEDPSVLAVRAVELLRDIYLDVPRVSPPPAVATAAPPLALATPPASPSVITARVSGGIGMLSGRDGLGPSAAPLFALGESFPHHLMANALLAGPFANSLGDATSTRQWIVMFALRYELGMARARPFVTAATGLHYITASFAGSSTSMPGGTSSSVAPLLGGGVGLSVRIASWLFVSAEGQAFFTQPAANVTSGAKRLGRAGAPSQLFDAALSLSFP